MSIRNGKRIGLLVFGSRVWSIRKRSKNGEGANGWKCFIFARFRQRL